MPFVCRFFEKSTLELSIISKHHPAPSVLRNLPSICRNSGTKLLEARQNDAGLGSLLSQTGTQHEQQQCILEIPGVNLGLFSFVRVGAARMAPGASIQPLGSRRPGAELSLAERGETVTWAR